MVVQVFIATTQPVQSLGHQITHLVRDHVLLAGIVQGCRDCLGKSNSAIRLAQQHETPIRTQRATFEIRLNLAATQSPKAHRLSGTIWHRRNSF